MIEEQSKDERRTIEVQSKNERRINGGSTEDDRRTNGGRTEIDRMANDSKTICDMFFYYNILYRRCFWGILFKLIEVVVSSRDFCVGQSLTDFFCFICVYALKRIKNHYWA